MEAIRDLIKLDYVAVILSIFIIMSGIIAIYNIVGKFSEIIGRPFKWVKNKDADHKMLLEHEKKIKDLASKHKEDTNKINVEEGEIKKDITKLTNMFLDKQISDYRWEIINLADKISNGKTVSKECFRHAITTHSKYEAIIAEYGLTNGEVKISMEIINKAYLELMKDST